MKPALFAVVAIALLLSSTGQTLAQTSFINPNGAGGYTIITPGAPTTDAVPAKLYTA